jgi:Nif-specific regulatory protein
MNINFFIFRFDPKIIPGESGMNDEPKIERLQSALEELRSINGVVDKVSRTRETNHIMSIIIDELVTLSTADQGIISLITAEKKAELTTVVRKNQSNGEIPYQLNEQITGWVLKNKAILKIDEIRGDDRFPGLAADGGNYQAVVCFPMMARGEIIGLTTLVRHRGKEAFSDNICRVAGIIISQTAQILSNAILLEELARKNKLLEVSQRKLHEDNIRLMSELDKQFAFENIIGKSAAIKKVLMTASKVAANDSPLLITGPTGTGKELIARAIHYNSPRRQKPFVIKNCGIKTETLLEAELFGYVKGAFTGADRDKPGLFREADGGSIFLDEIGEAPLSTQVAILRVIETGEIRPVGASRTEFVNVRVISATNRNLQEEMKKGQFRPDLYYRLSTFLIELPALRERREDIPLLVHQYLQRLKIKLGIETLSITPSAMSLLSRFDWPGNIRQLENELERAAVVSEQSGIIDVSDLSPEIFGKVYEEVPETESPEGYLKSVVEKVERDLIGASLAKHKGNILQTSKALGLTRKGLKDKMARYGIKSTDTDDD